MSRLDTFIRFPLAAAMLAAMTTVTGAATNALRGGPGHNIKPVEFNELPGNVKSSIRKEADGGEIETIIEIEEQESGTTMYQAETVKDGRQTQIEVKPTGELWSVETELTAEELPSAVKRAADAETLGYPARSFTLRDARGVRTYLVNAATHRRGKHLEISETGEIISKELKLS